MARTLEFSKRYKRFKCFLVASSVINKKRKEERFEVICVNLCNFPFRILSKHGDFLCEIISMLIQHSSMIYDERRKEKKTLLRILLCFLRSLLFLFFFFNRIYVCNKNKKETSFFYFLISKKLSISRLKVA